MTLVRKDFVMSPGNYLTGKSCVASCVYKGPSEQTTPGQWWGIFVHRFIEKAQLKGRSEALAYIAGRFPRALNTCKMLDIASLPKGHVEPSFVVNVLDRSARIAPYQQAMPNVHAYARLDLMYELDNLHGVIDFKCGYTNVRPETSYQMRTQSAFVRLYKGADHVTASIVPALKTGFGQWHMKTFTPAELDDHLDEMSRTHLKVVQARRACDLGQKPEFVRGDHCERCKVRPVCPAHGESQ